jgi:NADPH:quinone reductase-like Zn-dependent oxidoreductase
MKAAILRSRDADAPEYGDFAEPVVDEGHELVELVASGIHPVVRSLASGSHYGSTGTWPAIPGIDAVVRTPAGALIYTGFVRPPYGTLAERMAVPRAFGVALPAGCDAVKVAGGVNPGLASWLPLRARAGEVDALGTVMILGVTGMAGTLAVQNANALGAARVVGVGRNPAGLERAAKLGANVVALTADQSADAAAIAHALAETAPSIVLDFLWGVPAETTFTALARRGLDEDRANIAYVQIGATAGPEASLPASLLRSRRIRISGSGAGSASMTDIMAQVSVYVQLIADGKLEVPTQTYPLDSIGEAWNASTESNSRTVITGGASAR